MITIPLSGGLSTVIDDGDAAIVSQHKWHARDNAGRGMYVTTNVRIPGTVRKYRTVQLHRLLMNAGPDDVIDHKNRDGLDNRRDNLRVANRSLNAANSKHRRGRTNTYRGVYFEAKKRLYAAQIRVDGKLIQLGRGKDPVAAARRYDAAARQYFGEFAVVNFATAP